MRKIFVPIDGPTVEFRNEEFSEGLEFVAQATYGRVLFTRHDTLLDGCSITLGPEDRFGIYIPGEMRHMTVQHCCVTAYERALSLSCDSRNVIKGCTIR